MALTIHGYRVAKKDVENLAVLKGRLTVKPYVPSVFVNPQFVTKYKVFKESEEYMYIPKPSVSESLEITRHQREM